jgi:hypothetical protein
LTATPRSKVILDFCLQISYNISIDTYFKFTEVIKMASQLEQKLRAELGLEGFEYISDTQDHTPPVGQVFSSILIVTDATITTITPETVGAITGNPFVGVAIPKGTVVHGRWTKLKLAGGTLIAYKGI